jgi:hypothetical protein
MVPDNEHIQIQRLLDPDLALSDLSLVRQLQREFGLTEGIQLLMLH